MTITDSVKQKKPKHKLLEKYTIKERTRKEQGNKKQTYLWESFFRYIFASHGSI